MSPYIVPYVPNLKEIATAVPEIRVPETRRIFFIFFFFLAPNNKSVRKLCSCAPISTKFDAQVALAYDRWSPKIEILKQIETKHHVSQILKHD